MIVVDTSAVMAVLWDEPTRPAILAATAGETLTSSERLWWEVGNAISKAVKIGRYDTDRARLALGRFSEIRTGLLLEVPSLERAVEIAMDLNIYAYDAYMLAVALGSESPLLTLDGPQRAHARRLGLRTVDL